MLIPEDELERMRKRFPYPRFSKTEYERRYRNIKNMMREHGLDCLLIVGGSAAYGRLWFNIRYVTNMMGKAEMANYCFFPKDDDPCLVVRSGHALASGMLARTAVREVIVGDPDVLTAIVNTIQARGYEKGRVGIVEYDPFTSIPKNHWDFFTSKLPQAEFVFVTKEFIALRLLKSAEEIEALERSAEVGDIAVMAIVERMKPGMTEGEVFGIAHEAALKAGGEMGMIQLASAPMDDPDTNDQRPRPVNRVIGPRDFINNEVGIFYNGYESQTGKPIVTGTPSKQIQEMFDIALEAYKRIESTLRPGKSSSDSLEAAKFVHDTGYDYYGSFLQGMLGANPRHEPQINFDQVSSGENRFLFEGNKLMYKPGMMFTLQVHLIDKQNTCSLFLGDSFVITERGAKCLNKVQPQMFRIK